MGHVYLITDSRLFKIGSATNISNRIKALQTGNGTPLSVVSNYTTDIALLVEKRLHNIYQDFREAGEWFRLPQRVVDTFTEICAEVESQISAVNAKALKAEVERLKKENAELSHRCKELDAMKLHRDLFAAKCLELYERCKDGEKQRSDQMDLLLNNSVRNACLLDIRRFISDSVSVGKMIEYIDSLEERSLSLKGVIDRDNMRFEIVQTMSRLIFIAENSNVKNALTLLGMVEDDFIAMSEALDKQKTLLRQVVCPCSAEVDA